MHRWFRAIMVVCLACGLAGWGESSEKLTILAGSELADMEPLLPAIKAATGVDIQLSYTGTLDGAERIMKGDKPDAAWFSHNKYLLLLQGASRKILAQEKTMLSPVIIGVKESAARSWGWLDKAPSWRDVAQKSAAGELRFAMTHPASSNSGFSALVAVTVAFANKGDALTTADIQTSVITDFFKGQRLTAGSSGWLTDAFVANQDQLNGMVNYESGLMQLNQSGKLRERLALIYPTEGVISADYPLMLLDEKKKAAFDKVVAYLRSPAVQTRIMTETQRRPITPQVKPSAAFGDVLLIELPFPDRQEIVDRILFAYLDEHKLPAHVYFVLDVSGSMQGDRLAQLRKAMGNLTGQDHSLSGQFTRFGSREKVTAITFNSQVQDVKAFEITGPVEKSAAITNLQSFMTGLQAGGETAIYSAVQRAYELARTDRAAEPNRYYSIVLLTDGENNQGISPAQFASFYRALAPGEQSTKIFPILFGSASEKEMKDLADLSAGRMFDGKQSLEQAFKTIRGYQ
jgi:Ca-activated chloride channel family protein